MSLPYRSDHAAGAMLRPPEGRAANSGLVFDKFFDGWNADFTRLADEQQGKRKWVEKMVALHKARDTAERGLEAEMAERQRRLADALEGKCWQTEATARFVTGTGLANPLENGFVWHHTGNFPYLPAS